jgi:hypothetical protein
MAHPQTGSALLACFEIGRDEPDLIDAGTSHNIYGLRDIGKTDRVVALNEGNFFGAFLENV